MLTLKILIILITLCNIYLWYDAVKFKRGFFIPAICSIGVITTIPIFLM